MEYRRRYEKHYDSDSSDDSDEEVRIVREFRKKREMDIQRIRMSGPRPLPEPYFKSMFFTPIDDYHKEIYNNNSEHFAPRRPRRKRSPLPPGLDKAGNLLDGGKDKDGQSLQSLSPLGHTKRRLSAMVSSAAAAIASRRLSAYDWNPPAPAHLRPQIVRRGRALCLQYMRTHIRRALVDPDKKQTLMIRLKVSMESECSEEMALNYSRGVLKAMRVLCAALERKEPDAFRQVARQSTRAPIGTLRSEAALTELAYALGERITRDSITWSKIAAIYCMFGVLAREVTEVTNGDPSLELVTAPAAALADLLHEETGTWIIEHGGWEGLVERLRASTRDPTPEPKTMKVLMWVFIIVFIIYPVVSGTWYFMYRREHHSS